MTAQTVSTVSAELADMRGRLASITEHVGRASVEEAVEAVASVKVAREWAKVRKLGEEMRHDLIWVEAVALRRMGQIGHASAIPKHLRACANRLAQLDDADLRQMLADHPSSTALGSYRRSARDAQAQDARLRGSEWARGLHRYDGRADEEFGDDGVEEAAFRHAGNLAGALAVVLNEALCESGMPLSTQQMALRLVEEHYPEYADDRDFIRGVASVVREAMTNGPVPEDGISGLPAFIPCRTGEGTWWRLPQTSVKFSQLDDYVTMRQEQVKRAAEATDRLVTSVQLARARFLRRCGREATASDGVVYP